MVKQPYRMTKLSEIRPYDRNPRIIPQAAVDAVARSIQAFGFRAPIVVDANGIILAGHTRYKAAQQLGLDTVPVVWQSDITEIQARGYRIADNKVAEIATWDRDALDDEVRELAETADADLDALGLASWELERILADATSEVALEPDGQNHAQKSTGQATAPAFGGSLDESNDAGPYSPVKLYNNSLAICYADEDLPELAELLHMPADRISKLKTVHFDRIKELQVVESQK